VADRYLEKFVRRPGRREGGRKNMEHYIAALRRATVPAANGATVKLEAKPITAITTADVEAVRDGWKRRAAAYGGAIGADRALKRLRHFFNWAIEKGYTDATPFKRHGVTMIHYLTEKPRSRRLEAGEEAALLKPAPPFLYAIITAMLETGMRPGELLALRWRDVKGAGLLLPAEITKTNEARDVPITQRLKAVLELRKHAPDGTEHPPEAFVFGNEVGERIAYGALRQPWEDTCKAAKITGLQIRDLRREFASRLLETPGVVVHTVRDWLGHADLATTSRYLSTTRVGLQQARRAFEENRAKLAQNSHKSDSKADDLTPDQASETAANSLQVKAGAEERTRTSTTLRPQAPESCPIGTHRCADARSRGGP
jgi:integrase